MSNRKLTTGFYRPTESYKSIREHIAVCFEDDLTLVAVVGASDDDPDHVTESNEYAALFAAAPNTLQKLSHTLARIAELEAANENTNNLLDEQGTHINKQALKIQALTAFNESMQTDAAQNTITVNMLMAQLAEVNEENRGLRQMLHMEPK